MKFHIFLIFTLLSFLSVVVKGQGRVCRPGAVFRVACNMCRCNFDGTDMACTRKMCAPEYGGFGKICEPGTHFKKDCNTCTCNDDGTNAACTLKACL